jgi:hypothetical protein
MSNSNEDRDFRSFLTYSAMAGISFSFERPFENALGKFPAIVRGFARL